MRNILISILLTLGCITSAQAQGVIKNFFKYSTFYTSFNMSNPMVQEDVTEIKDQMLRIEEKIDKLK